MARWTASGLKDLALEILPTQDQVLSWANGLEVLKEFHQPGGSVALVGWR
jgi:hypothetical protein